MKKTILFLTLLMSLALLSCSDEDNLDPIIDLNSKLKNSEFLSDSVYMIDSLDDLFAIYGIKLEVQDTNSLLIPSLRATNDIKDLQQKTVYGYTSITNTKLARGMFRAEVAQTLGLYQGRIYHFYWKYVTKTITVPTNGYSVFEDDSPNCGYQPINGTNSNTKVRGYSLNSSAKELRTHILYIQNDEWAGNIKRDYPCSPANLEWKYIQWRNF